MITPKTPYGIHVFGAEEWKKDGENLAEELAQWETIAPIIQKLWDDLTDLLCPCTLFFYRKNKPKLRNTAKASTRMQNINSYATSVLLSFDDFVGILRSMKHKGFGEFIGFMDARNDEVFAQECRIRYDYERYRSIEEVRQKYKLTPLDVSELQELYPSKAWGQLGIQWPDVELMNEIDLKSGEIF